MLNIIYQDDQILVLDKPAGLVVDDSQTQQGETLQSWLAENYPSSLDRMGIVHRLDKDTSGVILVAKTQEALENLQTQFKERTTKKEYLALVHGLVEKPGRIEGAIVRNPGNREKFIVVQNPTSHPTPTSEVGFKEAETEYEPIQNFKFSILNFQSVFNDLNKIQLRKLERMKYNQFTLVRCFPLTGRTHQIRVHLKYAGFPIVADEKYGGRKVYRLDHRWCGRQFLHAAKIGFYHPDDGRWMEFESELPEDLKKALSSLRGT